MATLNLPAAGGRPVEVQVLMSTPAGNMEFLTVTATFESGQIRMQLPEIGAV